MTQIDTLHDARKNQPSYGEIQSCCMVDNPFPIVGKLEGIILDAKFGRIKVGESSCVGLNVVVQYSNYNDTLLFQDSSRIQKIFNIFNISEVHELNQKPITLYVSESPRIEGISPR